jgi:hypothetical protein
LDHSQGPPVGDWGGGNHGGTDRYHYDLYPGPALVVIPLGLGILATEFDWAKKILHQAKSYIEAKTKKKNIQTEEQK